MNYQTLYRTLIRLVTFLLIPGCTKELPVGEGLPEGEKFTKIVFTPSDFTKTDADLHTPAIGKRMV